MCARIPSSCHLGHHAMYRYSAYFKTILDGYSSTDSGNHPYTLMSIFSPPAPIRVVTSTPSCSNLVFCLATLSPSSPLGEMIPFDEITLYSSDPTLPLLSSIGKTDLPWDLSIRRKHLHRVPYMSITQNPTMYEVSKGQTHLE